MTTLLIWLLKSRQGVSLSHMAPVPLMVMVPSSVSTHRTLLSSTPPAPQLPLAISVASAVSETSAAQAVSYSPSGSSVVIITNASSKDSIRFFICVPSLSLFVSFDTVLQIHFSIGLCKINMQMVTSLYFSGLFEKSCRC